MYMSERGRGYTTTLLRTLQKCAFNLMSVILEHCCVNLYILQQSRLIFSCKVTEMGRCMHSFGCSVPSQSPTEHSRHWITFTILEFSDFPNKFQTSNDVYPVFDCNFFAMAVIRGCNGV